jgi:hypothetical protein
MSNNKRKTAPGESATRRRDYEFTQTITKGEGTYQRDCMETITRYIVSEGKVVAQIGESDIEWLRTFSPNLKPFGFFAE